MDKAHHLLKAWREKNGITAAKFAEMLGVTERTVWRYEAGDSRPPIESMVKIRKLTNIELEAWAR